MANEELTRILEKIEYQKCKNCIWFKRYKKDTAEGLCKVNSGKYAPINFTTWSNKRIDNTPIKDLFPDEQVYETTAENTCNHFTGK